MAGLVGYDSSDGEDDITHLPKDTNISEDSVEGENDDGGEEEEGSRRQGKPSAEPRHQRLQRTSQDAFSDTKRGGESVMSPGAATLVNPLHQPRDRESSEANNGLPQPPASPYSAHRALLRDLTRPSLPNLDLPPSPPGSPPPALTKKVETFLELKSQGIHFNAKLDQSSALRNPSLMDKLLRFVGVDEKAEYATTLPTELWNPAAFPDWAYRTELKLGLEKAKKEREMAKAGPARSGVDFVPAASSGNGDPESQPKQAAGLSRREKPKSAWQ